MLKTRVPSRFAPVVLPLLALALNGCWRSLPLSPGDGCHAEGFECGEGLECGADGECVCTPTSCPDGCCTPDGAVCRPAPCDEDCIHECPFDGDRDCGVDGTPRECGADLDGCLAWVDLPPCEPDEDCVGGQCVLRCAAECRTPGAWRCTSERERERCELIDGCARITARETCDDDAYCDAGECLPWCPEPCEPVGSVVCPREGFYRVCQRRAHPTGFCANWSEEQACGDGLDCSPGHCLPDCASPCTTPGPGCPDWNVTGDCQDVGGCPTWVDLQPCDSDEYCLDGLCEDACDDPCPTPGAEECRGDDAYHCVERAGYGCNQWEPTICGEGWHCEETGGEADCVETCPGACDPLEFPRCFDGSPSTYETCEPDEAGCHVRLSATCPAGYECGTTCAGAPCYAPCEDTGARRCRDGDTALLCVAGEGDDCGPRWDVEQVCADTGELCRGGVCSSPCDPEYACDTVGEPRCGDDGAVELCASAGTCGSPQWVFDHRCGDSQICLDGECVTTCPHPCPGEGEVRCSFDSTAVETCTHIDGLGCDTWLETEVCTGVRSCRDGACRSPCLAACDPDDVGCSGPRTPTWCDPTAGPDSCPMMVDGEDCAPDEICVDGACTPICSGAELCDEDNTLCDPVGGLLRCVRDDAGCTAWAGPIDCGEGMECRLDECRPLCEEICEVSGAPTCLDPHSVGVCVEDLETGCPTWVSSRECGSGRVCRGGACAETCTASCLPEGDLCLDDQYLIVCVEDVSGCLGMAGPILCPAGTTCIVDACLPP